MVLNKYAFSLTNSTAGTQGNLRKMTFNKNIMDIGENVAIPSISLMSYDETIVSNIIARNNLLLGPNTNFSADTTYLYLNDGRSLIYENSNSAPSSTLNDVYFYSPYKRDSIDIFFGSNSVFSSNTSLSILKSSNYTPQVQKNPVHLVGFLYNETEKQVSFNPDEYCTILRENQANYEIFEPSMSQDQTITIPAYSYYKFISKAQENLTPFFVIENVVIYDRLFDGVNLSKEHFYLSTSYNDVTDRLPTLEDDYIISTANHYNMQLYSPSEEEEFMGFYYQYDCLGMGFYRWSESILPRPTLGVPGYWEGGSLSIYLPSGIALPEQFTYYRTFISNVPPVEKKLIHMVGFTEAVNTINEPEGGYFFLQIDDDSYKIRKDLNSPIEAGTFYKYNEASQYTEPEIVIDNIGFKLTELDTGLVTLCSFPKSSFDLGTVYSSVSSRRASLNSLIIQPTIQALNLVQGENPPGMTFYGFTLFNEELFYTSTSARLTGFYYPTQPVPENWLFYVDDKNSFELFFECFIDEVESFVEVN